MLNSPIKNLNRVLLAGSVFGLGIGIVAVDPTRAATFTYTGDTTGAPTWNRPQAGNPPTLLSGSQATPYSVFQFNVDTSTTYNFLSTANWDNYTFLYQGSFNAATPLANVIIGNDDFGSSNLSGFNGVSLTAGTDYFFVTTGYWNFNSGAFTNTITGNGNVTAVASTSVPEPFTVIGTLIGGTAAVRMRKKLARQNWERN